MKIGKVSVASISNIKQYISKYNDQVFKVSELATKFELWDSQMSVMLRKSDIPRLRLSAKKVWYGSPKAIKKLYKHLGIKEGSRC